MAWSFETDSEFQKERAWVQEFVEAEIRPTEHVVWHGADVHHPAGGGLGSVD